MSRQRIAKYLLPVFILMAGFAGMKALVFSKVPPARLEVKTPGALVDVQPLTASRHTVTIAATGTVRPAVVVSLMPQVSGRVVRLTPGFKEGGFFKKGDLLFEIEDTDYRLNAEKIRSQVAQAEYNLARVSSQARVARQEWEQIKLADKTPPNDLVLYKPQLKNAQAELAASRASLEQALLDISRTRIYAPFNCRVRSKSIAPGQYVRTGSQVATLVGTDAAEIIVPVSLDDLPWLEIPRTAKDRGAQARVSVRVGQETCTWQGAIDRSLGEADSQSRMLRLAIEIPDPYGLGEGEPRTIELSDGLFVDVALTGKDLDPVFALPTRALRHNETLWLMGSDNRLEIKPVQVLRREKDVVLVQGDIPEGAALVLTRLSGAVQGMKLRLNGGNQG